MDLGGTVEPNRYAEHPDHPLAGIHMDILRVARMTVAKAATWNDVDPEMVDSLADAVVLALAKAGYITSQSGRADG